MGDKTDEFIDGLKAQVRELVDQAYDRGVMDERARILLLAQNIKPQTSRASSPASAEKHVAAELEIARNAEPSAEMLDAAGLPPLTEKQATVFKATISSAGKSIHRRALMGAIMSRSGLSNIQDSMSALCAKGYIRRGEVEGRTWYFPLAEGEPRVEEAKNARRWEDDECEVLLKELRACHERGVQPKWDALSKIFGRTPQAVEQKARMNRWYPGEPRGVFAEQIVHEDEESESEPAPPPPTAPAPQRRAEPADVETRPLEPKKVISVLVPAASVGPNAARPQQAPVHTSTRKINAAEYLKKRGVRCEKIDDAWWTINGVKVTKMTVLIEVNKHRYAADLAGVDIDQIE